MSIPYHKVDNSDSKAIASTDSFYNYSLNAIDWVYNTKNELWLKVECLDWSTAECCDCGPTKRKTGWIYREVVNAPSLFSEILQPYTIEIIDDLDKLKLLNKNKREVEIDYGWYVKGYGGLLFMHDTRTNGGWVNINGTLTHLDHVSEATYPNKSNLEFDPYYTYKSKDLALRIYNQESGNIQFMEIYYQDKDERILITDTIWENDPYGY